MATLVNHEVVVRINGNEITCRCIGQSVNASWIKVMLPDGDEQMVPASEFILLAEDPFAYSRALENRRND